MIPAVSRQGVLIQQGIPGKSHLVVTDPGFEKAKKFDIDRRRDQYKPA